MLFPYKVLYLLSNVKIWIYVLFLDVLTGLLQFITKYIFNDITYLKFLVIACFLDLLTGITKVVVTEGWKHVTSRGMRDTVLKAIQYGSFLIITHVLTHFEINSEPNTQFIWLNKIAFEFLILIEIKSVYENIIRINPKLDFARALLKKLAALLKPSKESGATNKNNSN